MNRERLRQSNLRVLRRSLLATAVAFGFGFALAPFYDVLCEKVFGIRPRQQAGEVSACSAGPVTTRELLVEFDTSIHADLPWRLDAARKSVKVHPCEPATVVFTATNDGRIALSGRAVFNVAPSEAAIHLTKTECFCFTEQRLEAGESRAMPVRFIIDDQLPAEVSRLTFRYVFNPVEAPAEEAGAAPTHS